MTALHVLSGLIVVLAGLFCVGLALVILLNRAASFRFLSQFAGSARAHFVEQLARLCAGGAMISFAPFTVWSQTFGVLGWILIITSVALMLVPWRVHRRFAEWSLPWVFRNFNIYAGGAFALGAFILYATLRGMIRVVS